MSPGLLALPAGIFSQVAIRPTTLIFGLSSPSALKVPNTEAAPHKQDPFLQLLKKDATMTLVGAPAEPHPPAEVFNLIFKRRQLAGSLIGGIAETQEMLDFCARHGIVSDIEMIAMAYINDAYERMLKSDVKYRFVIDMKTLS